MQYFPGSPSCNVVLFNFWGQNPVWLELLAPSWLCSNVWKAPENPWWQREVLASNIQYICRYVYCFSTMLITSVSNSKFGSLTIAWGYWIHIDHCHVIRLAPSWSGEDLLGAAELCWHSCCLLDSGLQLQPDEPFFAWCIHFRSVCPPYTVDVGSADWLCQVTP